MEFVNSNFAKAQKQGSTPNSKGKQGKNRGTGNNQSTQNGNGTKYHGNQQRPDGGGGGKPRNNKAPFGNQKYQQIVSGALELGKLSVGNSNSNGTQHKDASNLGALFNGLVLKSQEKNKGTKPHGAGASNAAKIPPQQSPEELTMRLNTEALLRVDPAFTHLHGSASQVAVYDFDSATNYWTDTKTVGCLFLYSRSTAPEYGLVVLNRKGLKNLVMFFDKQSQIIPHDPYLLFRRGPNEVIKCIWFYKNSEFHTATDLFRNMGVQFDQEQLTENGPGTNNQAQSKESGPNLFAMLKESQAKIDNVSQKPKVLTAEELEQQMFDDSKAGGAMGAKSQAEMHGGRLQSLRAEEAAGGSLLNKFSLIPTGNSASTSSRRNLQKIPEPEQNIDSISPRLNDASRSMRTVEQLEKDLKPDGTGGKSKDTAKKEMSNELLATLGIKRQLEPVKDNAAESNSDIYSPQSPFMTPTSRSCSESERSTKKLTIDDLDGMLYEETDEDMVREVVENLADLTELLLLSENVVGHSDPQLVWRKRSNLQNRPSSALIQVAQNNNVGQVHQKHSLINDSAVSPLTPNQLSQAIMYLLQTDPAFVGKIHEAYVKSMQQPWMEKRLG